MGTSSSRISGSAAPSAARREVSRPGWTRRRFVAGAGAMVLAPVVPGCGGDDGPTRHAGSSAADGAEVAPAPAPIDVVDLPSPARSDAPLGTVTAGRRSVRDFATTPLAEGVVGQLLWAAQGITDEHGHRAAPSAGALYPLELLAVTTDRVLRYLADRHRADVIAEGDVRPALMAAAFDQESIGAAPLVVVVTAVRGRTAVKYGDRAGRYVDIEVGHAAQNLLLHAVALGLGAVPVGGFDDDAVADVLALPAGWEPRYLIAVGRPAGAT
jgi:SagB-type dehydrogenase family enzyme